MASFDASKEEMQALSRQSEVVQQASAALSSALTRARGVRLCLVLAAVLLVAVICLRFYALGMEVQSTEYQNALLSTGQKRLAEKSSQYSKQVEMLIDKTSPALTKAFNEQIKKDMPEFQKQLDKEKDILAANLQEEFNKKVNGYYEKLAARQEQILKEEFPAMKDPVVYERMVKNIDKVVERIVKTYFVDDFRQQIKEMQATWDNFPEADRPKAGEPPLMDQFITTLLQYLATQLTRSGIMPAKT
jgi:hypothetical protein